MPNADTTAEPDAAIASHPNSKSTAIVALLLRSDGATLDDLTDATGWQKHSARAALTGLKKKGHTIDRVKTDGVSRYRITGRVDE